MQAPLTEKAHSEDVPRSASAGVVVSGRYLPPPVDKDGKLWVRTSALILRSPEELYAMWHDVEKVPMWQEQMAEVRATGPKTSHWIMRQGNDSDNTIEWNSEIMNDEPGKRIAWRSTGGDSNNAGEVIFEPAPAGRGTMVTVLQEFRMGKLESAWETLTGRNPKQAVIENLRHFKALAETGEIPRIQGQPHGPRGMTGKVKESLYGETIATPPAKERLAS